MSSKGRNTGAYYCKSCRVRRTPHVTNGGVVWICPKCKNMILKRDKGKY